jgi:hypothetical protein
MDLLCSGQQHKLHTRLLHSPEAGSRRPGQCAAEQGPAAALQQGSDAQAGSSCSSTGHQGRRQAPQEGTVARQAHGIHECQQQRWLEAQLVAQREVPCSGDCQQGHAVAQAAALVCASGQ